MSYLKSGVMVLFLVLFIIPLASAKQGHIKLLAVSETEDGMIGTSADLYLELEPGSGRVFIDTFPFTKFDTQMSTRFAKEVSCKFLDADCDNYDFFYTIRASSAIVGGPSAGAALAVLTTAMLDNQNIDETISITGTINSGGMIGPVGGVKEKIEIAAKQGISKIIIPSSTILVKEGNETIDLREHAKSLDIELIDIYELGEALYIFTGKKYKQNGRELIVNEDYKEIMKGLAEELCSGSKELIAKYSLTNNTDPLLSGAINLTDKGYSIYKKEDYYSAASFCFGSGTQVRYLMLKTYNLTDDEIIEIIDNTNAKVRLFDHELLEKGYETITGLETYAIVKERIIQADDHLTKSKEFLEKGEKEDSVYNLAFAIERLKSAELWGRFYGLKSNKFQLDEASIKKSCLKKLSEADERIKYVDLYFPESLENTKKEITRAHEDFNKGHYELCLFKASKAKAEADIVLNVFGVDNNKVEEILRQKLDIVKRNIIIEIEKGTFPILGYSYYEYGKSLIERDVFSAMLYAEYALELSNLDMYFKKEKSLNIKNINIGEYIKFVYTLLFGIVIGVFITIIFSRRNSNKSIKNNVKRKK
jgi:uncharacterized protein